jgi:Ser-tRNA(Ala) deacylase AlaX
MIYPRSGCELEYLSEEWFNTCEIIISECQALGFDSVWLYDEFNWPSGQCGGRIMKEDPDHALKYFQVFEKNGEYSFGISSNPKAPDVLNPGAMKKFIEYTHEKYAERFGHLFGTLIKGIFTDEPAISYIGSPSGDEKIRLSYYPGLEEDYTALTGSSLRKDIIFTLRNQSAPFWKNFVCKLLGQRLLDCFVLPIRSWCDHHDLLFTGHLLAEHTLKDSFRASGSPMKVADGFSLPAIDEIATASQIHSVEWITLATAEHAMRKNGNGGMAELFALGPCDMTLAKIKRQIHLVSLFGTDRYLLAISPFDMRGNTCGAKSQYFNPFTGAQPFFPAFAALNRDVCASAAVARKEFLPEIEIRRPTDEAQLSELLIQLVKAQRQWRLIDEEEEGTAPAVLRIEQEGISTEKMPDGKYVHHGVVSGTVDAGEAVVAQVDCTVRLATARNHTATHLLHKALREVLGDHVHQSGSSVDAQRLRFDFSHMSAVTAEELAQVEQKVNEVILQAIPVTIFETGIDEAKALGFTALFGEKYGDVVRCVQVGDYSMELCGGTHLDNISQVGLFKIVSEGAVAAGVRRIEAVTGMGAYQYTLQKEQLVGELSKALKANEKDIVARVEQLAAQNKDLEKQIAQLHAEASKGQVDGLLSQVKEVAGVKLLACEVEAADMNSLRDMSDMFRDKLGSGVVVLGAKSESGVNLIVAATKDLTKEGIHAGNIIKEIAKVTGGGGGGRPDMAQAGGKDYSKLADALALAEQLVAAQKK